MQIEHFKVELADKSIQAIVNLWLVFFSRLLRKYAVAETSGKRYILMIYVFQLRKFAIVKKKKGFLEVQKINI